MSRSVRRGGARLALALLALSAALALAGCGAARTGAPSPDAVATAEALADEGRRLLDAGDASGAAERLEEALRLHRTADRHYALGNARAQQEDYQGAARAYQDALALDDGHVDARANLAVAYYNLGRHEEARRELEKVLERRPDDADLHYNLGGVLMALGELRRAEEELLRAQALDPDLAQVYLGLGALYLEEGRPQEAREALRAYLERSDDPVWREAAESMLQEAESMRGEDTDG